MRKSKFTEAQIVAILKEGEAGVLIGRIYSGPSSAISSSRYGQTSTSTSSSSTTFHGHCDALRHARANHAPLEP